MPADLQLLVESAYRKVPGAPDVHPPVPDEVVIIAIPSPKVEFRDLHHPGREFVMHRDEFRAVYDHRR
jgi:hypothetical protein